MTNIRKLIIELSRFRYVSFFLSFGNYLKNDGGVDKIIAEQITMLNDNEVAVIQVSPVTLGTHRLGNALALSVVVNGKYEGLMTEDDFFHLIQRISDFGIVIKGIVIHHLKKFDFGFLKQLFNSITGRIYLYLHDYYLICDQYFLLKNNGSFCGEEAPSPRKCSECRYYNEHNQRIEQTKLLLQQFESRICCISPSEITKRIVNNVYPSLKINVVPHQLCIGTYKNIECGGNLIKIAYIGKYVEQKGRVVWEKLIKSLKRKPDWKLMYFGNSKELMEGVEKHYVQTTKDNPQAMTQALRNSGISIAFLWSTSPETYSYTYYEAYASNAFILTDAKSGNIADMVRKNKNGIVFETESELFEFVSDVDLVKTTLETFKRSNQKGPLYLKTNDWLASKLDDEDDAIITTTAKKNGFVKKFLIVFIDILYRLKNKM